MSNNKNISARKCSYYGVSQKLWKVKWRITLCKEHSNARNLKFCVYLVLYSIKTKEFFRFSKTFCQIKILCANIVAALHSFFHLWYIAQPQLNFNFNCLRFLPNSVTSWGQPHFHLNPTTRKVMRFNLNGSFP